MIRPRVGSEVTIFEINTRGLEDRAGEIDVDEEASLEDVPLLEIDTELESEIKQLSRDVFGVESELISNAYTTFIITPSTDYDDIPEFLESLTDLIQTGAKT